VTGSFVSRLVRPGSMTARWIRTLLPATAFPVVVAAYSSGTDATSTTRTDPSAGPVEQPASQVLPTGDLRIATSDIDTPWAIAFVGATPLVSERNTGAIVEVLANGTTRTVGTVEGVVARGEGGLLRLAVDGQRRLLAHSTREDKPERGSCHR